MKRTIKIALAVQPRAGVRLRHVREQNRMKGAAW